MLNQTHFNLCSDSFFNRINLQNINADQAAVVSLARRSNRLPYETAAGSVLEIHHQNLQQVENRSIPCAEPGLQAAEQQEGNEVCPQEIQRTESSYLQQYLMSQSHMLQLLFRFSFRTSGPD